MIDALERSRTITWADPRPSAVQALKMSGLEALLAYTNGTLPQPPISILMDMGFEEVEHGRIVFTGTPAEYHYNPIGTVHGGFAATLLDSALGCAVHSTLPAGVGYTTLELHVNYIRAITAETGILRCEGKVIHAGKQMATAEAKLTDVNGKLYAHGSTTCLIFPLPS